MVRVHGSGPEVGEAAPFSGSGASINNEKRNELTLSGLENVAVGSNGNFYVVDAESNISELEPSGELIGEITEGRPLGRITAMAVDPTTENLLVAESAAIYEFSPGGEPLAKITEANGSEFENIQGLAVDSSGTLYAADPRAEVVDVFGAAPSLSGPTLELTITGSGAGTVTSSPSGIACSSGDCAHKFKEGKLVTLTAVPAVHSRFVAWTGCEAEPSPIKCEVTMSAARAVEAEFAAIPQATLDVTVEGAGKVISSPAGIACTSGTCTEHFDTEGPESTVTLFATASPDNHFEMWEGECEDTNGTECTVAMSAVRSVKSVFAPTFRMLTVTPTGPGSVSAAAGAITGCEEGDLGSCAGSYREGSIATLVATLVAHHHVTWGAGECKAVPSANVCEVEIGAGATGVHAAFSINTHILTVAHSGLGSVSANEGAIIDCSAAAGTCSGTYDETATITLTATPAVHKHVVWGGGCTTEPSPNECEVEVGPSDSVVEVAFPPNKHLLALTPIGQGSVRADSGAITHCTSAGGSCAGAYIEAATVTLIATPAAHQAVAWSGCTQESGDTCMVTVGSSDADVGATFSQIAHSLTVGKAGSGQGSVTCDGAACASSYPEGTSLTLAAHPASGSTFIGWSGAGCLGTGACQVTIEADTSVTASFDAMLALRPPAEQQCVVPKLAGRTLNRAKDMLSAANCALGKVSGPKASNGHKLVRSSSPSAGTTVPAGAKVDLRLGTKPEKKRRK